MLTLLPIGVMTRGLDRRIHFHFGSIREYDLPSVQRRGWPGGSSEAVVFFGASLEFKHLIGSLWNAVDLSISVRTDSV